MREFERWTLVDAAWTPEPGPTLGVHILVKPSGITLLVDNFHASC